MIDKHEGVTDWEAAARIAMARADREAEAKVIILDFVEEMRDTLTMILAACGRGKQEAKKSQEIDQAISTLLEKSGEEIDRKILQDYDADPIPPSDAGHGL